MVPSLLLGFEAQVVIKKIDVDKHVMVVFGGGRERLLKVADDATFQDAQGNTLAGGLTAKELKDGLNARLTVERKGQEPMIQSVRLGGDGGQAQAGRAQAGQAQARQAGRGPGGQGRGNAGRPAGPPSVGKPSVGFKPLTEMTADDKYKGEDGGLYGGGRNEPPAALRKAAAQETAQIVPLGADGKPAQDGKIVFVSISMSNATMEFAWFKKQADADPQKSAQVTIADLAQGGQTMARWADPDGAPWSVAMSRLEEAGLSPAQVQVAWVKLANARPTGELSEHGKQLETDTIAVLQNAKAKFPNLRIAYLASRIYGGYADGALNPEPYAYEGAFVCRWLIQKQMQGAADLNYDARL
ncbi:MAG TPA: hypothetical protein VHY20_11935, partial [Pirellulales bacterium]|nr:hypothetical protein [Pirellulales bacterium]